VRRSVAILTGALEVNDASVLALDLAPALAARGHEVTVYGGPGPMESRIASRGVPVVRAPDPFGLLLPKRREWLREIGGADLIHVVDPRQARRGGRLAFLTGRPWVLSVTSVVPSAVLDAIHRPSAVLVSCRSARDEFLLSRPGARHRVHVVPPGVDAERFPVSAPPFTGEIPVVGTITEFDAHSGIPDLLRAGRILEERGRQVHTVVAGFGPKAMAVRRAARESGLGSRVTVTSLVRDYEALFATIDVFVSPRTRDWFGAPILASQAAGRPVVATGVGASFAVITEAVNGRLVPASSPAAMASAVESLIDDPEAAARMGREARRMVVEHHTPAVAAERTERIYEEVLSDGG